MLTYLVLIKVKYKNINILGFRILTVKLSRTWVYASIFTGPFFQLNEHTAYELLLFFHIFMLPLLVNMHKLKETLFTF
jgi:hypothetical protein